MPGVITYGRDAVVRQARWDLDEVPFLLTEVDATCPECGDTTCDGEAHDDDDDGYAPCGWCARDCCVCDDEED